MANIGIWLGGSIAGAVLGWAALNYADRSSVTCSSDNVIKVVTSLARNRVEALNDQYGLSISQKPHWLVGETIKNGSAQYDLGFIRDRGAVAGNGGPRCAAILTVHGARGMSEQFTVNYTVERDTAGQILVSTQVALMRN